MVEANTIRGCLLTYGVDCDITRNYLTGGQVGLATAQAFVEMGSDAQSGVMKGLAEASRDKNYGAQPNQDGTFPFVTPANRPKANVAVKNALACMTFAMQCLSQRGVPADEDMVTSINSDKARKFYHQAKMVKKDKAGTDSTLELSVLASRTQPNSTTFRKWNATVTTDLKDAVSGDGFTPLYCAVRSPKTSTPWTSIDFSTQSFDEVAWRVMPLGGIVHRQDCKKLQAALMKATVNVGNAFIEMHKLKSESGREAYLELKGYYYGTQSIEDQRTTIVNDIAKVKFVGGNLGKSFEDCCGDLRTLHQALEDINRAHSAERKVLDLLAVFKRADSILTQGIQNVRTDFTGKRVNFEDAVKHLKEFIPKVTDPARSIRAVEVEGNDDGMPAANDEEGKTLTKEERVAQCEKVNTSTWRGYPKGKQYRITTDREYFGLTEKKTGGRGGGRGFGRGGSRGGRGRGGGGGRGNGGGREGKNRDRKRQISKLKTDLEDQQATIATMKAKLAAMAKEKKVTSGEDDDDSVDPTDGLKGRNKKSKTN